MGFHEIQFPSDISYGSSGGPEFSTTVAVLASGQEQRNSNWSLSRNRYNIAWGVKNSTQLTALLSFFYNRIGKAYGFRYKDWSDFTITLGYIGLGTAGGEDTFQIIKRYSSLGVYDRTISKPIDGTLLVYVDGALQTETTHYVVDYETGIIVFESGAIPPEGDAVTVTCEFDVPVRFDTDHLPTSIDNYGSRSALDIRLIEVRV